MLAAAVTGRCVILTKEIFGMTTSLPFFQFFSFQTVSIVFTSTFFFERVFFVPALAGSCQGYDYTGRSIKINIANFNYPRRKFGMGYFWTLYIG
jgi:hypothetical protein